MKFFLDTEFMEDGRSIELLSIGVVDETGREFYRQNANADVRRANAFVRENVLPHLLTCPKGMVQSIHRGSACGHPDCPWRPAYIIARDFRAWVEVQDERTITLPAKPEFWGYYADYDWVAICFLFGRMVDLPVGWPQYCRDIKQWCDDLGNPSLPEIGKGEHNSLADARWNRDAWHFLNNYSWEFARTKEYMYAGKGDKQEVSPRKVDQESGHLRGVEAGGGGQVHGSGNLERGAQEDGSPGKTQKVGEQHA